MTKEEAIKLAEPEIPGSTVTEVEDFGNLYVVHFVNDEYYRSGDPMDMLVGAGPIIIEKSTKKLFKTGSARSAAEYAAAYNASGDIYADLTSFVLITDMGNSMDRSAAILAVKKLCDKNLGAAKNIVDELLAGRVCKIKFVTPDEAKTKLEEMVKLGFVGKQLWSNQI